MTRGATPRWVASCAARRASSWSPEASSRWRSSRVDPPALVMRRDDVDIEDTIIELDGGWKADHMVEYLQEKLGDADTVDPARVKARAAAAAKARKRTKAKPKSKKAETKLAGGAEL